MVTGKAAPFYATAGAITAAFISAFWLFGYVRLSERLKKTANDPSKVMDELETFRVCLCLFMCWL